MEDNATITANLTTTPFEIVHSCLKSNSQVNPFSMGLTELVLRIFSEQTTARLSLLQILGGRINPLERDGEEGGGGGRKGHSHFFSGPDVTLHPFSSSRVIASTKMIAISIRVVIQFLCQYSITKYLALFMSR